jgi:hypothetical protein
MLHIISPANFKTLKTWLWIALYYGGKDKDDEGGGSGSYGDVKEYDLVYVFFF